MKDETIFKRLEQGVDESKTHFSNGAKLSACVFIDSEQHWDFIAEVMRKTIHSNPLHITHFSYISQCEAEMIRMTLDLYNGDKNACGIVTSGGSESIYQAILAYREHGRKKGITRPNLVVSETAHAAFLKSSYYL